MGTSLDHHLRDGKSEPLARAKASLKDRLRHKMVQEALNELNDTDRVVDETMDALASNGDALREAKEAFKQHLLDQIRRQAMEEVAAEIEGASLEADAEALSEARGILKQRLLDQVRRQAVDDVGAEVAQEAIERHTESQSLAEAGDAFKARLRDHLLRQAVDAVGAEAEGASNAFIKQADGEALTVARDAFKQRLLDHVLKQAIEEIDAEVDLDVEAVAEVDDDEASVSLDLQERVEELYDDLMEPSDGRKEPEIGTRFWEDEEIQVEEMADPSVEASGAEGAAPEEDDHGFFLSNPTAPGSDSAVGSNGKAADESFDLAGDGAWQQTNPIGTHDADEDAEADAAPTSYVYYLYGLLSGVVATEDALPQKGIDPHFPIYPFDHDHVQALVSKVAVTEYGADALQVNLLDPVWKEHQAAAHERFVEHFSQEGLFLPVPYCTIYESEADVRRMLSEISYLEALEKIQGRSQWHLKLYRNVEVLHQQVVENSKAVQQLMADIKSKPKKGAHTIKKKMVSTIREEEAAMTDNCTKDAHERLFSYADDVELGALNGAGDRENVELILEATYLVPKDKQETFLEGVEQLIGEYNPLGFDFDVSGPAPPTLFARLNPAETPAR